MAFIPAYMRVRQYVVDLALRHEDAAARIMSEREICRKFKVSRTTARKALSDLIDEGWIIARHGSGMFVNTPLVRNSAFRQGKFKKILLIIGDGKHTTIDGFFMDIVARVCDTLKEKPVLLQTANLVGTRDQLADEITMNSPDGILWIRPPAPCSTAIKKLRRKIPVAVVGNIASGDMFHVTMDYKKAGVLAASWFIERGITRTAFIGYSADGGIRSEVFRGWCDAFSAKGHTYDKQLCIDMNTDLRTITGKAVMPVIQGIFTFGSEFPAVDRALPESTRVPIVADGNYFGMKDAVHQPAAELVLFDTAAAVLAAENIFRMLHEPGYDTGETVLPPRITARAEQARHGETQ